jgi:DNA-binding LacI/PurR family transcriptional regulator
VARTSIREVAVRAGVSVGTVSNVLNRPDLVAEATRARVRSAIGELGFVRNESARRLRQGNSKSLGVVLESMSNPYFTDIARGAEAAMNSDDLDALWCTSDGSATKEWRCLEFLEQQHVSGVLITPVGLDAAGIIALRRRGLAVTLVDRRTDSTVCSVRVDHIAGGDVALTHLLGAPGARPAYVTGPMLPGPVCDRHTGALRALRRAGRDESDLQMLILPAMTASAGQQAARRLLRMDPLPTAAFCANDLLAIGLVNELLRNGVKVPEEIAVVGYDDIELAETAAVPLTTVRQPRHELGWAAAELAIAESADPEGHAHEQLVLRPELIVRESA